MTEQQESFYLEFFNNLREKSFEEFSKVFTDLFSIESTIDSFDLMMFMESINKELFQIIYNNRNTIIDKFINVLNECEISCKNVVLEFKLIFGENFIPSNIPVEKLYSKSFFHGSWELSNLILTPEEKKTYFEGVSIVDITSQEMFDELYDTELVQEIAFWIIESEFPKFEEEVFESFKHNEINILNNYFHPRHLSTLLDPMSNGGFEDISHLCESLTNTIPKTKEWEDVHKLITKEPTDIV